MYLKNDESEYNFSVEVAIILAAALATLLTFFETLLGNVLEKYFSTETTIQYDTKAKLSASMMHRYERLFENDKKSDVL